MSLRVAFICVVPSPYQRDLFAALAARPEVDLHVYYMERAAPDSPWPEKPLAPYEEYLRGFCIALGSRRVHVNWPLPDLSSYDVVVLNTLMSFTAQYLMRVRLRRKRWVFWGERLTRRGTGVPPVGQAGVPPAESRTAPSIPFVLDGRDARRPHGRDARATVASAAPTGWSLVSSRVHHSLIAPLRRAAAIAGIGRRAMEDYQARFAEPQHFNIPYHCDLAPFLAQPPRVRIGDEVTFLFCGQMIARKGLDSLLDAFAQLGQRARLLLVGREAELPQMLAPLPPAVRARIEYAGFQPPDDLPRFFAQADVFVLPSRYDGWGVVVNQALGAGLPIICSDQVGAGYDLVTDGENGLIFPASDAGALRSAMQHFLEDPARIDQYGEASRARAPQWQPAEGAAKWVAALQGIAS